VDIEGEARASFHRAVDVARAQGARSWELRALTSLCRLERRCGGDAEPRRQLHDLCEAFTEGRNTRDWREANDVRREPLAAIGAVGSASETAREARSDQ
jgi:adenylate cyclase